MSDKTYDKMAEGLAEIGLIKQPFPPKSAIVDGSFVQAATVTLIVRRWHD